MRDGTKVALNLGEKIDKIRKEKTPALWLKGFKSTDMHVTWRSYLDDPRRA